MSLASTKYNKEIEIEKYLNGLYLVNDIKTITMEATFKPKFTKQITVISEDIEIRNVGDGLNSSFVDKSYILNVSGTEESIKNFDISKIGIFVDANGLESGTYNVNVQFDNIGDVIFEKVSQIKIKIK